MSFADCFGLRVFAYDAYIESFACFGSINHAVGSISVFPRDPSVTIWHMTRVSAYPNVAIRREHPPPFVWLLLTPKRNTHSSTSPTWERF
jgi:hypothetical protein